MNIPRHWARASRSVPQPAGGTYDLIAWGWSSRDTVAPELADLVTFHDQATRATSMLVLA